MITAVLYVKMKDQDQLPRILIFAEHNDAVNWMVRNSNHPNVQGLYTLTPEIFKPGEQPDDLTVQK